MKDVPMAEWAQRLLEDQIQRISELRNASPRDPGFKLWRQTTLTVIQRIWPGDLVRSERFRIPFTPASTKASRTAQKQHYERGCVEASHYLRMLITEIEAQGVTSRHGGTPVGPARLPADLANRVMEEEAPASEVPDPSDLYEPSPLASFRGVDPSVPAEAASEAAAPETAPEVPLAPPPLAVAPAPAPPPRAVAPPPAPPPPAPPPPAPLPPAPPPPRSDRRALKEMLGFADPQSTSDPQPPAPPTTPAFRPPPHAEDFAPPLPPLAFSQQDIEDFPIEPEEQTEEPADLTDADAEALEIAEDVPTPPSADPSRDLAIEFLRRSPAMGAVKAAQAPPRAPAAPPPAPATPPVLAPPPVAVPSPPAAHTGAPKPIAAHTPAAAAFAMLAGEVARLGVPEGQRAAARAALTDMAQRLSSGTLKWDSVCQVLTMAAAYPELARRVVPLLVAFLDVE